MKADGRAGSEGMSQNSFLSETLIANFIENGRKSIKFTIKFTAKLAKNALLDRLLAQESSES